MIGTAVVTIFAVLLIIYWLFEEVQESDPAAPIGEQDMPVSPLPPDTTSPAQATEPGQQTAPIAPQPQPQGTPARRDR
ncbi:hypothetical protein ACFSHQ_01755 [Gemmobacter lanyuensis]